jgi:hypothetical protein
MRVAERSDTFSDLAHRLSIDGYAPGKPAGWSDRELRRRARIVRETPCSRCGETRLAPAFWWRTVGHTDGVAVGVCINRECDGAQIVTGGGEG